MDPCIPYNSGEPFRKGRLARRASVEEGSENVYITFIDQSAIYLVEQVHKNESMENESVKSHFISWFVGLIVSHLFGDEVEWLLKEHILTGVHDDQDGDSLINNLTNDVSPHDSSHDLISSADTRKISSSFLFSFIWLSAKSNRCEGIHNQVDPKELNDIQR